MSKKINLDILVDVNERTTHKIKVPVSVAATIAQLEAFILSQIQKRFDLKIKGPVSFKSSGERITLIFKHCKA